MMNPSGSAASGIDGAVRDSTVQPRKNSKKPKYSRFTQQELPACKPILSPQWVISTFTFIGMVFLPIGFTSLSASQKVVEIVYHYDEDCLNATSAQDRVNYIQSSTTEKTCTRTLIVPKPMKAPVYVYYELENFYQNHRRYVKSRSDKQLRSHEYERETGTCFPEATTSDGQPIVPCGLIAWSMFNDTYLFYTNQREPLEVSKKDIAWKSDQNHKFGEDVYPKNFQSGGLIGGAKLNASIPLSKQVDLIVWMRTAALPTFRKLYGKIERNLQQDENITVVLQNNYNTYSFGGKKKLVLSTMSWIGGKNEFLGIAYITVGGLSLLLAVIFLAVYMLKPRPLGDPSYLSWNKVAAASSN